MDNRLNPGPASQRSGRLGARGETMLALLTAVSLMAAAFFGWRAYIYAEEGDPVASAAGTFERRNDLIVLTYRMEVVSESVIRGPVDLSLLERRRLAIIPAQIDYRVPLSGITRSRMIWDASTRTLRVTLPPLRISKPNLDEARARVFVDGVWVSRKDAESLARKNSEIAERKAVEYAKNRQILDIARAAARETVRDNLVAALRAAGYPDAVIEVRFEGEG